MVENDQAKHEWAIATKLYKNGGKIKSNKSKVLKTMQLNATPWRQRCVLHKGIHNIFTLLLVSIEKVKKNLTRLIKAANLQGRYLLHQVDNQTSERGSIS